MKGQRSEPIYWPGRAASALRDIVRSAWAKEPRGSFRLERVTSPRHRWKLTYGEAELWYSFLVEANGACDPPVIT